MLLLIAIVVAYYVITTLLRIIAEISGISAVLFVIQIIIFAVEEKKIPEWEIILAFGLNMIIDTVFGLITSSLASQINAGLVVSSLGALFGYVVIQREKDEIEEGIDNTFGLS